MPGWFRQEPPAEEIRRLIFNGVLMPKRVAVTGRAAACRWLACWGLLVVTSNFLVGCRPASSPVLKEKANPGQEGQELDARQNGPAKQIRWANQNVDRKRLERAIQLATDYMVRACDEQGHFEYLVHLDPEVKIYPEYNIVRHVGAMMGLAVAHQFQPAESTKQALLRADRFLKEKCVGPIAILD